MQIGRRIYYDKATGNVILSISDRSGEVIETTVEQDFAAYADLTERVPDTVGMIQLEYGQCAQDFAEGTLGRIDLVTLQPMFSYPDPEQPGTPQPPQRALSVQVADQEQRLADVELALADVFAGGGE